MIHSPRLWCFLVILCVWQTLSAQYRFDSWTTDNGLPQNGVRRITQTPDGYLWLTTFDGLVRFDGVKFTVFDKNNAKGIINNRFWVVYGAADGTIWAGTEAGDLTIYRNGVFTSYPTDQVPDEQILSFSPDSNGEILMETVKSFYYLRDGEFVFAKPQPNSSYEKVIYHGSSGADWTITPNKIQRDWKGQSEFYSLKLKTINQYLENFYEDRHGGLWIGDVGNLFYLKNGNVTDYSTTESFLKKVYSHRFWEEDDGSLWFATGDFNYPGVGLVRFKDRKFNAFGTEQGLSNDRLFEVFKDREGTIWVATNRGLNRLRKQIITSLSKKDGLAENEVYPILKARDGSIYVGSVSGLSRYKDGKFINTFLRMDGLSIIANIQSLWEDAEGRIWVGAVPGVFIIENGVAKDVTKSLNNYPYPIFAIRSDNQGNMWFATERDGVIKYKDGKIVAQYTTNEGLPSNDVKVIHEAKDGSLWFGTYGGISHFKDGKFTNYTTNEGLAGNFVRSIKEDEDGTFWIGTYDGGLSRFKDGSFFNFNTENGLFNNGVFAMVEDKHGNFWMSSNKGIFRVNKQQLNDFADSKISSYESFGYGKQDGMLNTECNGGRQPSAITDKDGQIWFPTLEGVAIVNPNLLQKNNLPPPIEIETIEIDRQKIGFKDSIELNPSQAYLDITYTALSLINSEKILFRHKLESFDENWVEAGTRRTVNYTHLPPGEYIFTVTATNSDGIWNPTGKSIKIKVLAPFYQTRWFIAALLLSIFGIGYLFYTYRIRQLKKQNATQEAFARQLIESQEVERKRIAQELHDGLGQNLLIIKNRAMLGLAVPGKDEQFNEIQESVTEALGEVRTIAYNLRPLHLERLGLTATIEEMIEQIDETSEIQINRDIEPIDNLFTKENEINFYRIVQECLNNIVKHSNATKASIEVFRQNQKIVLHIRDNGNGFDEDKVKQGLGLNGIAERVKILGGTYSIESEVDKGTTISVMIAEKV